MFRTIRIVAVSLVIACSSLPFAACRDSRTEGRTGMEQVEQPCGSHNGHPLYRGPKGGCYYYNDRGNKTYVDRKECNC